MVAEGVVKTHVLVIGSGGAGVRAAIEASRYGSCALVSKTIIGKGGCTTMAEGGYNAVLREQDDCEIHYGDTLKGGAYLNDPDLVRILVGESPERIRDLVEWGAVFDLTPECQIAQRPFGGQRFPRTCYAGDRTGHEIMATLVERLGSTDAESHHEVSIIDLMTSADGVTGAIGLDRNGEIQVFLADQTVLATGGGTRIFDISTNSTSGTGDGYAMGYRAGAELIDMEQVQFHPTGAVYPYDARGRLVTEAVRGEGGVLKNALGERFMKRYDPERMELSTRDVVSRSIATEILEGRGTVHGGVNLDVSHLPREVIEARLPVMLEQFMRYGVDIRDVPMEVAPTAHHIMGGLRIGPECRTTKHGLFACGEVSGGVHGANRLGGNALAETQVFGKRAGEYAGRSPKRDVEVNRSQIAATEALLESFEQGSASPAVLRDSLKSAMWEGAGIFRTAEKLKATLMTIERLQSVQPVLKGRQGLADCCTLRNMLGTARMIVSCALLREESRGAHVRSDIRQGWDPSSSPYGHTWISVSGMGIERVVRS
jgi:fumarate reductase (CoM/CoB) subunit A